MDTITVSIAIGLIVSLLFTEAYGLSAGGMIVPGYFALSLHQPLSILVTLLVALATFAVVRGLSRVTILYGRRRIVMMILVGFLLGALVRRVPLWSGLAGASPALSACFAVIGFILPGLIALWIDRQGLVETIAPLVTSSVVVRLALILVGMGVLR